MDNRLKLAIIVAVVIGIYLIAPDGIRKYETLDGEAEALFGDISTYAPCTQPDGQQVELYTGLASVLTAREPYKGVGTLKNEVATFTYLTRRSVYIHGVSAGRTPLLFLGRGETVLDRCMVEVNPLSVLLAEPAKLDALSCKGPDGSPLVLTVGVETTVDLDRPFIEFEVSGHSIADGRANNDRQIRLKGVAPGFVTLTTLGEKGRLIENCVIRVALPAD